MKESESCNKGYVDKEIEVEGENHIQLAHFDL